MRATLDEPARGRSHQHDLYQNSAAYREVGNKADEHELELPLARSGRVPYQIGFAANLRSRAVVGTPDLGPAAESDGVLLRRADRNNRSDTVAIDLRVDKTFGLGPLPSRSWATLQPDEPNAVTNFNLLKRATVQPHIAP
jgi:hypothetical protein